MMHKFFRKKLSMPGLLQELKSFFQTIKEPVIRKGAIPLVDCLLSGLVIFSLKYPSLLQFDKSRNDPASAHNLKTLYRIKTIPSDTYLRERPDERASGLRTPRSLYGPDKTSPTRQSTGTV